jgi:hypothetical protein
MNVRQEALRRFSQLRPALFPECDSRFINRRPRLGYDPAVSVSSTRQKSVPEIICEAFKTRRQ